MPNIFSCHFLLITSYSVNTMHYRDPSQLKTSPFTHCKKCSFSHRPLPPWSDIHAICAFDWNKLPLHYKTYYLLFFLTGANGIRLCHLYLQERSAISHSFITGLLFTYFYNNLNTPACGTKWQAQSAKNKIACLVQKQSGFVTKCQRIGEFLRLLNLIH